MKRNFWVILSSLLVIGLLAACSTTPVQGTNSSTAVRTLASTGHGEVYITPDIAYINVGIHTEADDVTTALNDNNTQAKSVSDTLEGLGVEAKDIQTTSFNVSPMSTYGTDGTVTKRYYSVDNSVYVTVRDLNSLGKLLDAVVKSGANSINGITFDIQNKDAANAQARDLAIQKAKAEATEIAKSAGVTLGDIQTISVSTSSPVTQVYNAAKSDLGGGGASSVPVAAGQMVISVDANLTYFIK